MGVDEIYFGKHTKFITVVSNSETGEPLWFGQDRKQETLDEFFRTQAENQRKRIEAACVDMWGPFTDSIENGPRTALSSMTSSTSCSMPTKPSMKCAAPSSFARRAHAASSEGQAVAVADSLDSFGRQKRQQLNQLFSLNRKLLKAHLLKESLERLWTYTYEGAMMRYLQSWLDSCDGNAYRFENWRAC